MNPAFLFGRSAFLHAEADPASFRCEFTCIAQQINENLVQAQGIPIKLLVDNPAGTDLKIKASLARLGLNYFGNLLRQTWKGYPHAVENQPGALNFTHIQHIVYQAHEMPGGQGYLFQAVRHTFLVIYMDRGQLCHAYDCIHRCADVMAHG